MSHLSPAPLPGITEPVSQCQRVSPIFPEVLVQPGMLRAAGGGGEGAVSRQNSTPRSDRSSLFGLDPRLTLSVPQFLHLLNQKID